MNTAQKEEVIELLKDKFSKYNNFYLTDTESLSVAQISQLRRACFDKNVEMKVAKNTMIKKAMDSMDADRFGGLYDSLKGVTALMFSESPKDPAVIISSFRDKNPGDRPVLKAALIEDAGLFIGDESLKALKNIKTKNELIGEVISLLQSPISKVIAALENKPEEVTKVAAETEEVTTVAEPSATEEKPVEEAASETPKDEADNTPTDKSEDEAPKSE